MTGAELIALADWCERRQPSREIDRSIAEAIGLKPFTSQDHDGESIFVGSQSNGKLIPLPRFTTSLDAAASMLPAGWTGFEVRSRGARWGFVCEISRLIIGDREQFVTGRATTEPMARCSAALRAKASL